MRSGEGNDVYNIGRGGALIVWNAYVQVMPWTSHQLLVLHGPEVDMCDKVLILPLKNNNSSSEVHGVRTLWLPSSPAFLFPAGPSHWPNSTRDQRARERTWWYLLSDCPLGPDSRQGTHWGQRVGEVGVGKGTVGTNQHNFLQKWVRSSLAFFFLDYLLMATLSN